MNQLIPLRESPADIEKLIYTFILISIVINSLSWVVAFKYYLTGTGFGTKWDWLISLEIYALGFGGLFCVFALYLFPYSKIFWLYAVIRIFGDTMTNVSDLQFIDEYDMIIFVPKLILTLTVLTMVVQKLKNERE